MLIFIQGCAKPKRVKVMDKPAPLLVDQNTRPPTKSKPAAEPEKPAEAKSEGPKLEITQSGVTLSWVEKGGSQMTASAKSADFNEVTQAGNLLDFSAKLYENGKLAASLSAAKATVDTAKRTVIASGGVTLKSVERDTTVKAGWIKWNANTRKIIGNGGVKVISTNGTAEAAAFVADTNMRNYTLLSSGEGLEK